MIFEEEFLDFVASIISTNSILRKKSILSEYSNSDTVKNCLRFLLDSNVKTGISKKKIQKKCNTLVNFEITNCYEINAMISYLESNNTGKDVDIIVVQNYLFVLEQEGFNKEQTSIIEEFLTKSLKLGIDSKIVNDVIPGLIPTFDIMLGTAYENANFKEGSYFYLTRKLNGTRCIYYKGKLYSRQGKEYTGLEHIIQCIECILYADNTDPHDLVFDGELILNNSNGKYSDIEAFQIGTGLANSKDKDKSSLVYMVFDILPVEFFEKKECNKVYSERLKTRNRLKKLTVLGDPVQFLTVLYEGTDSSKIWEWLEYAEKNDWEGVMLNLDTSYEFKRTKNLIKVKRFYTMDLPVVSIEEGTGKNKSRLGALVCSYKDGFVKVGSGFKDESRDYLWSNPSEIIGKIVEIKYKEKTTNKDGGESLQFPVFVRVRDDKTRKEVSYD